MAPGGRAGLPKLGLEQIEDTRAGEGRANLGKSSANLAESRATLRVIGRLAILHLVSLTGPV